jgi:beta-lactamase superfamily II metal-dependent hydrolase
LKWFEQDANAKKIVRKVWFNSGRLIFEHFQQKEIKENLLTIKNISCSNTSIAQGVAFEDFIEENNIWHRRIVKSGDEFKLFGLKFTILSPSDDKLQLLLCKWEKECPILDTSSTSDYSLSLSDLINSDSFIEDASIHNGSAIAFVVEKQEKRVLFLSDAPPQTIIESLVSLGYSPQNPLKVDFVKISHHGSKSNTCIELLNLIQSNNFLISSNGSKHKLPDKRCLARIIKNKNHANLNFNYPELVSNIFTEQDFLDYPDFSIVEALEYIEI